ncbi:NAD(P)H-dependent flavin oxidoreductase [Maribellus maritimus]|uniref:NAD(P)H-dependent flavin oxidoreductase n=1 Tax=Maribellus maritimus TaxID=2870838 RepID=UPI001EEA5335|nr:nitronate monooxygenase [Maribellus maritimus]MCG6186772.1 nitronate monooxygenase [Maribellus maritimus]
MNRICELFDIQYPVIQGGMVWCSGWKLAVAVSNSGGLGLIGAGSMHPEVLDEHIKKAKQATQKPFGVNVPLLYPEIEKIMEIVVQNEVPVVFTSAGSPKKWTGWLKEHGTTVVHVVSSSLFAEKSEAAGVDAIVAEGFEAGGHNGREETTTLSLIPSVRKATGLPLMAAGGIATGQAMLAAMALGADGVQVGSRFAISEESSAHPDFKKLVVSLNEGGTKLALKKLAPVRLIKNHFFEQVDKAEKSGSTAESLQELLGKGRAKKGIFLGDLEDGELEIGQVSAQIKEIKPVKEIMETLISEYKKGVNDIKNGGKYSL